MTAIPPRRETFEKSLSSPLQRLMHNPSTAPASERGPAPSLASYLRSCLLLLSGQPGLIGAAWAMPRRVPAQGRGRETELCIILLQGEVPKAEGVLLHQVLSGTCAGRTPLSRSATAPSPSTRGQALRGGAN